MRRSITASVACAVLLLGYAVAPVGAMSIGGTASCLVPGSAAGTTEEVIGSFGMGPPGEVNPMIARWFKDQGCLPGTKDKSLIKIKAKNVVKI